MRAESGTGFLVPAAGMDTVYTYKVLLLARTTISFFYACGPSSIRIFFLVVRRGLYLVFWGVWSSLKVSADAGSRLFS